MDTTESHKKYSRKRIGKRDYQNKLKEENNVLKTMIKQLMQDISAKEAQNVILQQQLQFFQKQIPNFPSQENGNSQPDETANKHPENLNLSSTLSERITPNKSSDSNQ